MQQKETVMRNLAMLTSCVAAIWFGVQGPAAGEPPKAAKAVDMDKLKPTWKVGDQWTVETQSRVSPARRPIKGDSLGKPARWEFTVKSRERLQDDDCFRVEAENVTKDQRQLVATLWVDQKSLTPRQVERRLPIAGGFRTITQRFVVDKGRAAPVVVVSSTALPLDLPLFSDEARREEPFEYEVLGETEIKRGAEGRGFLIEVGQSAAPVDAEKVKGLLHEEVSRSANPQEMVEITLKGGHQQVRQLWQAGVPWPLYADNGVTVARLVKFPALAKKQ
jgi:hypothetical protein